MTEITDLRHDTIETLATLTIVDRIQIFTVAKNRQMVIEAVMLRKQDDLHQPLRSEKSLQLETNDRRIKK